jgi:hypothetical protein
MSEATEVGSIVGFLRLDDSDWKRTIEEAKAKAAELGKSNPHVKVDVDAAEAQARILAITALVKAAGKEKIDITAHVDTINASLHLESLRKGTNLVSEGFRKAQQDATAALGRMDSSLIHSQSAFSRYKTSAVDAFQAVRKELSGGGGGGGIGGAASGAGGAGGGAANPGLIFYGIAAGALLVGPAVGAATAAIAEFGGVAGVAGLAFLGFKNDIKQGNDTGLALQANFKDIGATLTGLEKAAATGLEGGVLGSLRQVKSFLPTLNPEVSSLATHLGTALNTTTTGLVSGLKTMSPLLDDAGKYAESLATKFANFTASPQFAQFIAYARQELPKVGQMLGDVGGALISLGTSLQPAGDALVSTLDNIAKSYQDNKQAFDDLAKFLGAIAGGISWATKLSQVTGGGSGGPATNFRNYVAQHPGKQAGDTPDAVDPNIAARAAALKAQADAEKAAASAAATASRVYGGTALSNQTATAAIKQNALALAATTQRMVLENDAGGLLKQTLDTLSGKSLSAAQAQNTFEQALVNMAKKVSKSDAAVTGLSSSAVANRGELLQLVTSAEASAEAYGSMDKSGTKARQKLIDLRTQIINNAVANGENKDAVTAYIDSVLKIPAKVPATKVEIDAAIAMQRVADFKRAVASIQGKNVSIGANISSGVAAVQRLVSFANNQTAYVQVQGVSHTGAPTGGKAIFADGGAVVGPGTGTSDSINARLSNGEFVVKASATSKYRAALEAMNNGYADGGIVTLTPGKKPAGRSGGSKSGRAGSRSTRAAKITPTTITDAEPGGAVYGVATYLRSQLPDVRAAAANLSRAVDDAFQLRGVTAKLASVKADLANLKAASVTLSSGVASTLSGTVDPTKYTSIGDLTGAYNTGTSNNTHFIASERAAAAKGVNRDLLAQLVASGNSAGLDSAASGSRNDVNSLNKAFANYRTTSAIGGQVAGSSVYGSRIAADNAQVNKLVAQSAALENAVVHLVGGIAKLTNRPVEIKVDGKTIARAVIGSGEFQGVMDNLGHLITEKRR